MRNEIIAALDLGSTKVTCMIAKVKNQAAPEVIGTAISESKGLNNGTVINLDLATKSTKNAVLEAEHQANVKLNELYIGITGSHIKGESSRGIVSISRTNKEITPDDVNQVIEQAAAIKIPADREIIHTIPQEFIVDDQHGIKDPVGMDGSRLEGSIYIITGSSTAVQNIRKSVTRAGFKVREIVIQSIASSYALLDPEEQDLGCMTIDIGAGTTDVAIFYDNSIRDTFSLPLGGSDITNDISIGLTAPRYIAEQIKIKYGVARSDLAADETFKVQKPGKEGERIIDKKLLASIIAPRLEEIFGLLHKRIKYAEYIDLLPTGILLTGGTAKMPGIEGLAERVFGIPAKIGIPNTIEGLNENMRDPSFATPIGLLIYGLLHKNKKNMGKVPSDMLFTRFAYRMKKWLLE